MKYRQESDIQQLLNKLPVGVIVFEWDHGAVRMKYYNEAICKTVGYIMEECQEAYMGTGIEMVYEMDRESVKKAFCRSMESGEPLLETYRIVHQDGSLRWVQTAGKSIELEGETLEEGVSLFCTVYIDVTQSRQEWLKVRYLAEHDGLTGAYNMNRFCNAASEILQANPKTRYAIVKYDIHRFKIINELFGREMGDKILIAMKDKIAVRAKNGGCYGRVGGDMFVMMLPLSELEPEALEEDRVHVLEELNLTFDVSLYIGIYIVENIEEPVTVMCDRAQLALQSIKGSYVKHYAFYQDSFRTNVVSEQEIVSDIKTAIGEEQLCVYYQPVFSVREEQLAGSEALVRWNHPRKGLIPPGEFVPLFERNGFIVEMDWYVWEHVCMFLHRQMDAGRRTKPVSVNVSRIHLYDRQFPKRLYLMTQHYDIRPDYFRLEITESAYMDNAEQLLAAIEQLRRFGFPILMDDFGSGYSSLNMLKDIPMDLLKIDRAFMKDIGVSRRAEQIIESIIQVAKILRMGTVAEGVETRDQYEFMAGIGCDFIQGYYLAKAMPETEYEVLLERQEGCEGRDLFSGVNKGIKG